MKTFQYRLYPSKRQATLLRATLNECRWLYNHFLEERKVLYERAQKSLSRNDQNNELPGLKGERPSLKIVHAQVLQNVAERIDLAFKAFFRRVKAGEKPGYPRFRGRFRYDSFCYPQYGNGCKLAGDALVLSKIGQVKLILHRPLEGTPKTCCVRRTATGKWYVTIVSEYETEALPVSTAQVGVDVGLHAFATLSTGESVDNPRFFRRDERNLARAQRQFSAEAKGTPARAKRRQVVARIHERIAHKRKDFVHQHSRRLVNRFGTIAVEDIRVNRMLHNHCLAKSISDAAWSEFLQYLTYKAAWAGRVMIAVNPAYTSQTCSSCGHRQPMPLSERVYGCPCCGVVIDRDLNAAVNILALGLQSIGNQSVEAQSVHGWE